MLMTNKMKMKSLLIVISYSLIEKKNISILLFVYKCKSL